MSFSWPLNVSTKTSVFLYDMHLSRVCLNYIVNAAFQRNRIYSYPHFYFAVHKITRQNNTIRCKNGQIKFTPTTYSHFYCAVYKIARQNNAVGCTNGQITWYRVLLLWRPCNGRSWHLLVRSFFKSQTKMRFCIGRVNSELSFLFCCYQIYF